ncbi:tRNA-splicing endonuclease subunit Sen2 [Anopheles ziemanni]|nr:tRNA-splicing endonuclease subunit Sen2 [Anopheles ziemanni]
MGTKGNLFVHNLRPKNYIPPALSQTLPLPVHDGNPADSRIIDALFTGFSVYVMDPVSIRELCLNGGFGQGMLSRVFPACLTAPRETYHKNKRKHHESNTNATCSGSEHPANTTVEPLCLFLEEAFFLMHQLNMLKLQSLDDEPIGVAEAFQKFQNANKRFFAGYCAYLYLKSKNWIIKSGLKFGGDFVIYVKGPQFNHASYIVLIQEMQEGKQLGNYTMNGLDFQGFNRIAETTAKDILFLEVHYPASLDLASSVDCLARIKEVEIGETFTKHHNFIGARNQIKNK